MIVGVLKVPELINNRMTSLLKQITILGENLEFISLSKMENLLCSTHIF